MEHTEQRTAEHSCVHDHLQFHYRPEDRQQQQRRAIDTLVSAQNINSAGINAFATNESNFPSAEVPQLAALPIYTTATVGGATTILRTSNDAGPTVTDDSGNKLGNHRFIRFMGNGGNVTITANSTSTLPHDVDFVVYRSVPFAFYAFGHRSARRDGGIDDADGQRGIPDRRVRLRQRLRPIGRHAG